MPSRSLLRIEAPASVSPSTGTLVLLHGFGASEGDLISLGALLDPRLKSIAFRAPIALPWGGFAWYPLVQERGGGIDFEPADVEAAIAIGIEAIDELAQREGKPPILLGFSQGGGIATSIALQRPELARAVISLSGVPPMVAPKRLAPREKLSRLPVFAAHGRRDQLLPFVRGQTTRALLEEAGVALEWREYPIGHEISEEELADVKAWMARPG